MQISQLSRRAGAICSQLTLSTDPAMDMLGWLTRSRARSLAHSRFCVTQRPFLENRIAGVRTWSRAV